MAIRELTPDLMTQSRPAPCRSTLPTSGTSPSIPLLQCGADCVARPPLLPRRAALIRIADRAHVSPTARTAQAAFDTGWPRRHSWPS